jgi:hypothetical protein
MNELNGIPEKPLGSKHLVLPSLQHSKAIMLMEKANFIAFTKTLGTLRER